MRSFASVLKFILALVIVAIAAAAYFSYQFRNTSLTHLFPEIFSENIEYHFHSYTQKITGKQSLYVAKLNQLEEIEKKSYSSILGFKLPALVVSLSVPVEYNYFINLTAGWNFSIQGQTLTVKAPELSSSTPAIDISKLKMTMKDGRFLYNEKNAFDRLTQELPGLLVDRAIAHRILVKEEARTSVENFVRTWITQTTGKDFTYPIVVVFPSDTTLIPKAK